MLEDNETESFRVFNQSEYDSFRLLEKCRQLNVFSTIVFIFIGLIGNFLTIFVFAHRKFRVNSSNVYLLCLALNDSLFLIIHFFENTVKNYEQMYLPGEENEETSLDRFVKLINIADQFEFTCRFFSYWRYVLRFISAYIIVAFTIQRLIIVDTPLCSKFKTKKSAWKTISLIILTGMIINSWVPVFFEIQTEEGNQYCEIRQGWKTAYFVLTNFYILIILVIPIVSIFTSNLLIIIKTRKADVIRKDLLHSKPSLKKDSLVSEENVMLKSYKFSPRFHLRRNALTISRFNFRFKPLYQTSTQLSNSICLNKSTTRSNKMTKMLILVSFSYVFLNFPYLIAWGLFYNEIAFSKPHERNSIVHNYLFGAVQITEVFFILNYGLHFYFYIFSGSKFFDQLKFLRNIFFSF